MEPPKKSSRESILLAFNWLPILSFLAAFALLFASSLAIFGTQTKLNSLESLSSLWVDSPELPRTELPKAKESKYDRAQDAIMALRDSSARLNWMIAGAFQTLALSIAWFYFMRDIGRTLPSNLSPWRVNASILTMIILAGVVAAIASAYGLALDRLINSGLAYTATLRELVGKHFGVNILHRRVVDFENVLAYLVIGFGMFAAGATIAEPGPNQSQARRLFTVIREQVRSPLTYTTSHSVSELKARIKQLRTLLTISALVMIICAIQVSAQYRWPAAVLREKLLTSTGNEKYSLPLSESVSNYASSVTLFFGGAITLFMFAVFGSSFYVLNEKTLNLAKARNDGWRTDEEWLAKNGLAFSWMEIYADVAKIIGPLFVAALETFIKF